MSDHYPLSFEDRVAVRSLTEKPAPQKASADPLMLACELSEWQGDPAHCRWCNEENPTTAHRWCGEACLIDYRRNHWWKEAKEWAVKLAHRHCVDCAGDPVKRGGLLEVHHLTPVAGARTASCLHHQDNLAVLCQHHHQLRHKATVA